MQKIVCDFCEKNQTARRYKVKMLDDGGWKRIDICYECHEKLFNPRYRTVPPER